MSVVAIRQLPEAKSTYTAVPRVQSDPSITNETV